MSSLEDILSRFSADHKEFDKTQKIKLLFLYLSTYLCPQGLHLHYSL